ncbi:MAG TPA: hypothetical protein VIL74_12000 [Pyrinomonadaceae bacterium]|jgi:hypothetical protein
MKPNRIVGLIFLVAANLILAACANSGATFAPLDENSVPSPISPPADFSIPDGWVLFPAPKAESPERSCANRAIESERKVALVDGILSISGYTYPHAEELGKLPQNLREIVRKDKMAKGRLHIEPFENGWLIGADAGEWGGDLFWLSGDGKRKVELIEGNVRGIVKLVGGEVFILTGYAHMSDHEGKLYKLTTGENGALKAKLLSDLKTQPQAFAVESNESFLVALDDIILRVKASGRIELLKKTNFASLHPNSMTVTSSGVIYVGMRLFVARFVPRENGYAEEWLVPQNCRKFLEKDFDCVCQTGK